jgi:hypothetical protein
MLCNLLVVAAGSCNKATLLPIIFGCGEEEEKDDDILSLLLLLLYVVVLTACRLSLRLPNGEMTPRPEIISCLPRLLRPPPRLAAVMDNNDEGDVNAAATDGLLDDKKKGELLVVKIRR